MLQSLATLVFLAAGLCALSMIAVLVTEEWESVRGALGLSHPVETSPLPPRVRAMPARAIPILRVIPGEMRRAA